MTVLFGVVVITLALIGAGASVLTGRNALKSLDAQQERHAMERKQLLLIITAQHADPIAVQTVSRAAGVRPEPTTTQDERKPVVIATDI